MCDRSPSAARSLLGDGIQRLESAPCANGFRLANEGRCGRDSGWQARRRSLRPRQRTPSGICPAEGGDQAAGFRASGIRLRATRPDVVAAATADAFRDLPRRRRGSSGGIPRQRIASRQAQGSAPPQAGIKPGQEVVAAATADAFRDVPRRRRGSSGGIPRKRIPASRNKHRDLPRQRRGSSGGIPRKRNPASRNSNNKGSCGGEADAFRDLPRRRRGSSRRNPRKRISAWRNKFRSSPRPRAPARGGTRRATRVRLRESGRARSCRRS